MSRRLQLYPAGSAGSPSGLDLDILPGLGLPYEAASGSVVAPGQCYLDVAAYRLYLHRFTDDGSDTENLLLQVGSRGASLKLYSASGSGAYVFATLDPATATYAANILSIPLLNSVIKGTFSAADVCNLGLVLAGVSVGIAPWTTPSAWVGSTFYSAYVAGTPASCVTYIGSSYACTTSHTSTGSFDPSKWQLVASKGDTGTASQSQVERVFQVSHGLLPWKLVSVQTDGTLGYACFDLPANNDVYGIIAEVTNTNSLLLCTGGLVKRTSGTFGFANGATLWGDPDSPGGMTTTRPALPGSVACPIGIARGADSLLFRPLLPVVV